MSDQKEDELFQNSANNKLLFLKAIKLGISYGMGNNSTTYLRKIEEEIQKISNQTDDKTQNQTRIANSFDQEQTPINYENILVSLENKKNVLTSQINSLTKQNYNSNVSSIMFLKKNLNLVMKEIEKYKLLMQKKNQLSTITNQVSNQNIKFIPSYQRKVSFAQEPQIKESENNIKELENTFNKLTSLLQA